MARITIHCLVAKTAKSGRTSWYWQPSAALRTKGWKSVPLGHDQAAAIDAARALNVKVDDWRSGGAAPRLVKRFVKASTVGAMIARYRADRLPALAVTTRRTYGAALDRIERWAGDVPVAAITRARVRVYRDNLLKGASHHVAHATLRVLRALFEHGRRHDMAGENPASAFDLGAPPPRDQIWEQGDIAAFTAAAVAIGYPGLGFAVELAEWTGQREADLLALHAGQWRELTLRDAADRARLAGADGKVMGFEIRQAKTRRLVGIPIVGALRARVEAAIAANARRDVPVTTILVNDHSGRPWNQRRFIAKFVAAKERAVAQGHAALADKQFRDLRRTCVVQLGRLGLNDAQVSAFSGHRLETAKRILETYMPRDTDMAGSASVARIGAAPGGGRWNSNMEDVGTIVPKAS